LIKCLGSRKCGMTLDDLSCELEVSSRTVRRDLATLQEVGFPLVEQTGDFGRKTWRLEHRLGAADLGFTFDEALALYLGRKHMLPFAGTMLGEAMERAFRKIRASLDERALRYLDRAAELFQESRFGQVDYRPHGDILDSLQVAIEDRHAVFITYRSNRATEPVTYDVYPYRFVRHSGALYLVGYKPTEDRRKTWRVDRIEQVQVERVVFPMPAAEELDDFLNRSFGIFDGGQCVRVRIRFSPSAARFVSEKRWHASQHLSVRRDGSLIAEFTVSATGEFKSWILSFGREAQVLAPESLRQDLADEVAAMSDLYAQHL
jgi:predicted DNA-binding transcriptional regulator YafY